MSGRILLRIHNCRPPSRFQQSDLGLAPGSIWKCDCGQTWTLTQDSVALTRQWELTTWQNLKNWMSRLWVRLYDRLFA